MALWQFDVALTLRGSPSPVVTDEGYETTPLPELVVARATKYLTQHFGQPWEMMPRWFVFGQEDGNRFDVLVEETGVGAVSVRIDARAYAGHVLPRVTELAELLGCMLYVPERGICLNPTKQELEHAFSESRAARFVRDPHAFLTEAP